jgi:hypothetical protein
MTGNPSLTDKGRVADESGVIACLAKATKRDHSGDPPLVFLY